MEQSDEQDKTWFFLGEDNNIVFSLTLEWNKGYTPPAELVDLIELYSQGYRNPYCPVCKAIIKGRGKTCSKRCRKKLWRMKKKQESTTSY